jgi:hypothetical protein
MYGPLAGAASSLPVEVPTVLLAKSEADELLGDIFLSFPLAVVGAVFGYAALQTAKSVLEVEFPEGSETVVVIVAAVGGAAFLILLSNVGFLGGVAGVLAKALLDGWNVIANAVLKGALLKY